MLLCRAHVFLLLRESLTVLPYLLTTYFFFKTHSSLFPRCLPCFFLRTSRCIPHLYWAPVLSSYLTGNVHTSHYVSAALCFSGPYHRFFLIHGSHLTDITLKWKRKCHMSVTYNTTAGSILLLIYIVSSSLEIKHIIKPPGRETASMEFPVLLLHNSTKRIVSHYKKLLRKFSTQMVAK